MKKIIISFFVLSLMFNFGFNAQAATTTKVTTPAKTTTTKAKVAPKPVVSKVTWTSAALRLINRIPRGVRPAYKKKVEDYARRNKIKTITPAVVNGMRE